MYILKPTHAESLLHVHVCTLLARMLSIVTRVLKSLHAWLTLSQVNTQSRGYLFCADSKEDMEDWIAKLKKVCRLTDTPFVCVQACR